VLEKSKTFFTAAEPKPRSPDFNKYYGGVLSSRKKSKNPFSTH